MTRPLKPTITILLVSFFSLTLAQEVYAGAPALPGTCCQFVLETGRFVCENTPNDGCIVTSEGPELIGPFMGQTCNSETGFCAGFVPPTAERNVPSLSEWGLVTLAGILGTAGFIVLRRKKVIA